MSDEHSHLLIEEEEDLESLFAQAVASVERRTEPPAVDELEVDIEIDGEIDGEVSEDDGDAEPEVAFDPGPWGEPPPSAVDEANARAAALESELDLSRVRVAQLEDALKEAEAEATEQRDRHARLNAKSRRLKEAYDRLRLRAEDEREKLNQRESLLSELRGAARESERDRERTKQRVEREVDEARRFGNEKLFKELLPVLDHLDLAMSHADGDPGKTVEGIRMIVSQLDRTLTRLGLARVDSEQGVEFDPQRHEAITYVPHDGLDEGRVVVTHQVGYLLHERLLRAARVSVASGSEAPTGESEDVVAEPVNAEGAEE